MGIISVAVRSGICIYAVKYTYDEGAWSDADSAIKFKNQTCKMINNNHYIATGKAHFQAHVPTPELPELPSSNEIGFLTTHYYNQAVKSSIKFIEMLPCYAGQGVKKIKDSVEKAMEVPPPK